MPRRGWLWVAVLVGMTLLAGVVCICLLVLDDPINDRNFNRIEPGMSAAQVESILGRKPDFVLTVGDIELQRTWIGRTGSIDVAFDDNGVVVSRMPFLRTGEPTVLERVRSLLPR